MSGALPRRPLPRRLAGGWAAAVLLLGLAVAALWPGAGRPAPLSPESVLARAGGALPADASGVRVVELHGWRSGGSWRFLVYLAFREGGGVRGRSVLLPAPPVGGVLPVSVTTAQYHLGWDEPRLARRLSAFAGTGCVSFVFVAPEAGCSGWSGR